MAIVVVHQPQRTVGVLRREAEWVGFGDVERCEGSIGGGGSHRPKRRILVVRGDAAGGLVRDKVGDVLVSIVEVEEVVSARVALHPQGSSGDGLGRVPSKSKVNRVVCGGVQALDAEIAVVNKAVMGIGDGTNGFDIFDAAAHAVEGHDDVGRAVGPLNGAVLGVVGDGPDAGGGLDEGLVSVKVELGEECFSRRERRGRRVGNLGVLVEVVGGIGAVCAEIEGQEAVADVVVMVGVFILCALCASA